MKNIIRKEELNTVPFDKTFITKNGHEESCHSTGYEVLDNEGNWWIEYIDSNDQLHYGL